MSCEVDEQSLPKNYTVYTLCWVCFYHSAVCRQCVLVLYGPNACFKTIKLKKLYHLW